MAFPAEVGTRRLVVIVTCDCTDGRWWAQPEGGHFPVCQACGSEARPEGAPRTTHETLPAEEALQRLSERREHALGGILTVMMERDAINEPRDG